MGLTRLVVSNFKLTNLLDNQNQHNISTSRGSIEKIEGILPVEIKIHHKILRSVAPDSLISLKTLNIYLFEIIIKYSFSPCRFISATQKRSDPTNQSLIGLLNYSLFFFLSPDKLSCILSGDKKKKKRCDTPKTTTME